MKTEEILKTRKDEIIQKTLELMPQALSGDKGNRTFYFEIDENGDLKIDYLYYLGLRQLSDNCFYTIKDHETPDSEEYGYDDFEEMDFAACGYDDQIEFAIEEKILLLEQQ